MLSGFDLDAVACIYTEITNTTSIEEISLAEIKDEFSVELYNYMGELLFSGTYGEYKKSELQSGLYFMNIYNKGKVIYRKKVCKCSN